MNDVVASHVVFVFAVGNVRRTYDITFRTRERPAASRNAFDNGKCDLKAGIRRVSVAVEADRCRVAGREQRSRICGVAELPQARRFRSQTAVDFHEVKRARLVSLNHQREKQKLDTLAGWRRQEPLAVAIYRVWTWRARARNRPMRRNIHFAAAHCWRYFTI